MNGTVTCENCGTVCFEKDGYCKSCWKKLPVAAEQEDYIIDGLGQAEWEDYIEKNTVYYMDVYKKNEGKKFFLHINWSAFFFGFNWVLYRKMYAVACVGYLISFLLSVLFSIALIIPHIDEIKVWNADIASFQAYLDNGGETVLTDEYGDLYSPEIVQTGARAEKELYGLETKIVLKTLWLIPLQCLAIGLLGNALYKKHILKNSQNKNGGASVLSLVAGRLLLGAINTFALSPLISLIIVLLTR